MRVGIQLTMTFFFRRTQNGHNPSIWPLIQKMKALYFLQFLKLKERSYEESMEILWFLKIKFWEDTKWPYIPHMTSNQKNKTLYFLKLSKLRKIKCLHFLVLRSNGLVMAILSFKPNFRRRLWPKIGGSRGSTSQHATIKCYTFLEMGDNGEWEKLLS